MKPLVLHIFPSDEGWRAGLIREVYILCELSAVSIQDIPLAKTKAGLLPSDHGMARLSPEDDSPPA